MDCHALKQRAKNVSGETNRWMDYLVNELSGSFSEHRDAVEARMRATVDEIGEAAGQRDSKLVRDIGVKLDALRADVRRIGEERDEALGHRLEAVKSEATAELRQAVSDIRAAVTEEIAVAVRSTHEVLSARIDGIGKEV